MRIVAGIEYAGTAYHGWQTQDTIEKNISPTDLKERGRHFCKETSQHSDVYVEKPKCKKNDPSTSKTMGIPTLQTACENALSQVANQPISVVCAGRTDKGVHALGQVIHFDTTAVRDMHAWVAGSNHHLPHDLRLLWAKPIDPAFHARHSAIARCYRYILYNYPVRPALLRNQVSWHPIPLDIEKMCLGAEFLLGEHDFSAFRGANCQAKTTRRHIHTLTLKQEGAFIFLDIQANAFLHHMVRNIVGVLLAIGQKTRPPEWAKAVLDSLQRSQGGITAPPQGLYLRQVHYPPAWDIPLVLEDTGFY
jgi:tRNA pseudouridine38-40 synthase